MLLRITIAALAVALSVGAVMAQSDPIAARQSLMKHNNDNAKAVVQMMRGQAAFDAAKVDAAFAQWADTAQKLPGLFPDNSKTSGDTRATSKIWLNKKDFDAKAAGGCASCHAVPKQEDRTRLGGGLALNSPFGTFYVPNISSDPKDGIGAWSEAQFVTAQNKGTSPNGEHYYPAFPYPSYQRINIDDLRDLFGYLKTLRPVAGRVRDHDLPFPFNIRRTLGLWKLLFLDGEPFKRDPAQSAQWNRGAYLVNGAGHCAECHSPRNALGAVIASLRFTGGPAPDGLGGVPNITHYKLKDWTAADIAGTLADGMTPDADRVGGNMVEVVRNTSQPTAADRMAIAAYIKSLPAVEGEAPAKK